MNGRLLALALALSASALAQDDISFRTDVSLVHVDAEVLTKDGRIINGLGLPDFRVFDEGREQKLVSVTSEEQPLDLILLFDISASMRPRIQRVAEAARQAAAQLRKGDRVAIMCFNMDVVVSTPFVEEIDAVAHGVEGVLRLQFGGGTAIRHAVNEAAKRFVGEPKSGRRRAILVITDDVGMPASEITVLHNLWEADAVLSGLIVTGSRNPRVVRGGNVEPLAEKSGGDTVHSNQPGGAFVAMIGRIRSRYSLYYATPEGQPGTFHTIQVELAGAARTKYPGAKLSARHSYRLAR